MRRVRGSVYDLLHHFRRALPTDRVRDDAAGRPVNDGDNKCALFFAPTKVNSSSISSVAEVPGTGAGDFFIRN